MNRLKFILNCLIVFICLFGIAGIMTSVILAICGVIKWWVCVIVYAVWLTSLVLFGFIKQEG